MIYTLKNGEEIKIDEEDLPLVRKYNWQTNNGYVFRTEQVDFVKTRYYLHRELLNAPNGMEVDHINGDPSDNRRCNIRLCTPAENKRNRRKPRTAKNSKYKGVKQRLGKYEASIGRRENYRYLGTYDTEIEAAIAYNIKAKELYGEFANLNEIPTEYENVKPRPYKGSSKYRGVMFHKRIGKWQASIQHNKRRHHLGYFECMHEAARVYNDKALELLGDRAKLNDIPTLSRRLPSG